MKKLLIVFCLFVSTSAFSQYFNDGQDRSGIKWKRISSIHFEVIFPEGFEMQGERVVHLMEKSYQYTCETLKHKPKKISIVLHTETVKSNAFLAWAPSRIEMYATPHQQIYSQDWMEQLAIHEYRHMVQISKLESEMPKLMRFLFGEQAAALLTAAYLPFWFIEGDAVAAETGLSSSGRGRLPSFHKELKAQFIEKGVYSYDKAYLGSYKHHIPNYYQMGYFLVGGARQIYGDQIWEDVVHTIARKPFILNPLNRSLKKNTGFTKVQLYDTIFSSLKKQWIFDDKQKEITSFETVSIGNKNYTNYHYGFRLNDSTYIAHKTGLSEIGRFIRLNGASEEQVFTPGYLTYESVSGRRNKVVWVERLSHPRWYHSDRTLLRILDLNTNKIEDYKLNTKLFAPSLSPDLKTFVAVEANNNYQFFINIFDTQSGKKIKQISLNENDYFITPSYSSDGKSIVVVVLRNNQKGIVKIDSQSGHATTILPFKNQEISKPIEYNGVVYFIGGYTGTDNLYMLKNEKIYEVINSRFGLAQPSIYEDEIVYSNYTADGYQLVTTPIDSLRYKLFEEDLSENVYPIAEAIAKQEKGVIDFSVLDGVNYTAEKYKKANHLLNIHSWAPISIDPYYQTVSPGVSVMSQNLLSTTEFSAGYQYLIPNQRSEFYANVKYYGWYPIINVKASSGKTTTSFPYIEYQTGDTINQGYSYIENSMLFNTYIPFDLSKGKYHQRFQPSFTYNLSDVQGDENAFNNFPDGIYQSIESSLYFHRILKKSQQDLLSNFGFIVNLSYKASLQAPSDIGNQFAITNLLYLPGLKQNHGITIYNAYQQKGKTNSFSDRIRFPRGHKNIPTNKLYSLGIDYQLPLVNTDVSIINLVYIKRVNMKLFYDNASYTGSVLANNTISNYSGLLQSTGVELTSILHLLRFIAPIEVGFRTSY
jgi:hypothetical protein